MIGRLCHCHLSCLHLSTFSNNFSFEAAGPVDAKFQMCAPLVRGSKVLANSPVDMINMITIPSKYYDKLKIFFQESKDQEQSSR